ncbi:MAG: hypothetical protein ACLGXA_16305 [Acidobacteriota bacterium]
MQEAVNSLMLVCAAFASLAFGVLLAYGVCRASFARLFRHAGQVAAQRTKAQIAAAVSQPDSL